MDTSHETARLEKARAVFEEFRAVCFWHWDKDAIITEADIPELVRNLRINGGHRGMRLAEELCQ